jgi:hypothetical protein
MTKPSAYPPLDGLVDLACRDGVDIRPTLLRVLTDLYVQKPTHGAEEETQYVELALGLIDSVDAATQAAVSATLASYPTAPAAILGRLSGAPALPTAFTAEARPAPQYDLTQLFFAANVQERGLILANLDVVAAAEPHRPQTIPSDVPSRLETAALQRNPSEFGRILQRSLGIDAALADKIVRDYSGEPIVVAAKALGMKAAMLQRILLFLNPVVGQSIERVYQLAQLFDELTPSAAERMVAIWRQSNGRPQSGSQQRPRAKYEPHYADDAARDARSLATPARHQTARDRDNPPVRHKSSGR